MVACMRCSFCSCRTGRSNGRTAAVRPKVTVGEEVLEPRRLQQLEPTRCSHHSRNRGRPSDQRHPADDVVRPGSGDTFVTTNGRMHEMLLLFLQDRALEWAHCGGEAKGHSRRGSTRASAASTARANALQPP